jgi:hypothetical protein
MVISMNNWLGRTRSFPKVVGGFVAGLIGIGSLQAALDTYGVFKGEHYRQWSPSAPEQAEEYGVMGFATVTEGSTAPFFINAEATESTAPFPFPVQLAALEGRPEYSGQQTHSSAATRDEYFPDGEVTFTLFDFDTNPEATLTLSTPPLPPIPAVVNYAEAQAIDPSLPFTLRWNGIAGAGAQDRIWVQISSWNGPLLTTAIPGAPGALEGSATEIEIPAGMLNEQEGIWASIGFFKVGGQTAGTLPDSTALTGSYRVTELELALQDNGSGDAPTLVSTTPASVTFNVSTDTEVRFDFSQPMAPVEDITWTAQFVTLDGGLFTYTWINDGTTLVATYVTSFPPDSIISWALGEGFQNEAGVPLEGDLLNGSFVTGSGSGGGGDCEGSDPFDEPGSFNFTRALRFLQSGPDTVLPHPDGGAFFVAGFDPPPELSVSGAFLTTPAGDTVELSSFFGSRYGEFGFFPDAEVLNEALPPGTYTARVELETGSAIQLNVNASGDFPPAPELLNFEAAQAIDSEAPFTLQWNTFVGADANSFVGLDIMEQEGDTVFFAPNECVDLELAPTATSIVIPAGTLRPGRVYELMLNFYRLADSSEHPGSGISLFAAYGGNTTTTIRTLGGTGGENLRIGSLSVGDQGRFRATVTGDPGLVIIVEASSNLIDWETVTSLNIPLAGTVSFEDPNPLNSNGGLFYRVRTL